MGKEKKEKDTCDVKLLFSSSGFRSLSDGTTQQLSPHSVLHLTTKHATKQLGRTEQLHGEPPPTAPLKCLTLEMGLLSAPCLVHGKFPTNLD